MLTKCQPNLSLQQNKTTLNQPNPHVCISSDPQLKNIPHTQFHSMNDWKLTVRNLIPSARANARGNSLSSLVLNRRRFWQTPAPLKFEARGATLVSPWNPDGLRSLGRPRILTVFLHSFVFGGEANFILWWKFCLLWRKLAYGNVWNFALEVHSVWVSQ